MIFFHMNIHLTSTIYQDILFSVLCSTAFVLNQVFILCVSLFLSSLCSITQYRTVLVIVPL